MAGPRRVVDRVGDFDTALTLARRIEAPSLRGLVLLSVARERARSAERGDLEQLATEALAAVPEPALNYDLFKQAALIFAAAGDRPRATAMALELADAAQRADVFIALANGSDAASRSDTDAMIGQALSAARQIERPESRDDALARIATLQADVHQYERARETARIISTTGRLKVLSQIRPFSG